MKPILLKIKGLNSFTDEQIIDFEKLISKGIFGIFGPTGSGKTTVIDAITLALYGEISRYDGTKENKAFFNTVSDELSVLLKFSLKSSKTLYYEISRVYKRKKDGTIGSPSARLLQTDASGEVTVIADKAKEVNRKVIDIIGLNYDDFTRSVILPQGKFSRFLMLENKERRDMLERIFGLQKYGSELTDKLNEKKVVQKQIVDNISSQLEILGDFSENRINELENKLDEKNRILEQTENQLDVQNKLYKEYEKYILLCDEKEEYKKKKEQLDKKKLYIEERKIFLDKVLKADNIYSICKNYKETEREKNNNYFELEEIRKKLALIENDTKTKKELYDEAFERKEKEYSVYLKKESELIQAGEYLKYVKNLENERNILRNEYKNKRAELTQYESELRENTVEKEKALNKIQSFMQRKSELTVEPHYRNEVGEAAKLEEKYNDFSEKINSIKKLVQTKKNLIFEQKKKSEKIEIQFKIEYKKYEENKYKIEKISNEQKRCPDLFVLQNEFLEEQFDFEDKKTKKERLEELKKFIKESENEKNKNIDRIETTEKNIEKYKKKSEQLKQKLKQLNYSSAMAEVAKHLHNGEACPLCGATEHPNLIKFDGKDEFHNIENEIYEVENSLSKYIAEKQKLDISVNYIVKDIEKYNIEAEPLYCFKEFDIIETDKMLQAKKKKLECINEKKEKLKSDREMYEEENKKLSDEIKYFELQIAEIKKSIEKDEETIEQYEKDICDFNLELNNISTKIIEYRNRYNIKSFIKENELINAKETEKAKIEKDELKNRQIVEKCNYVSEEIMKSILSLNSDIQGIKTAGKEKKGVIDRHTEIILKLSDGKDVEQYKEEITAIIKEIVNNEKNTKEDYEKSLNEKNSISENEKSLSEKESLLQNLLKKQKEEYTAAALNNGFAIDEDISVYVIEANERQFIKNEIYYFEKSETEIIAGINNIDDKLIKSGINCSKEDFENLKIKIQEKEILKKQYINDIGAVSSELETVRGNFKTAERLLKEFEKQKHKYELINEIISVTQGNKFVEYAAKNQLRYITKEASLRLLQMSGGKYSITLDDDESIGKKTTHKVDGANFIIRDNYNGGLPRIPKTLSGGEVFLTSLSLALALSSKIQLKNSAPLEVFFLDEGFGTLDFDLLETVMDSLEQLSLQKINVGIISHVEELKNRIPIKLNIIPPSGGAAGSKVFLD